MYNTKIKITGNLIKTYHYEEIVGMKKEKYIHNESRKPLSEQIEEYNKNKETNEKSPLHKNFIALKSARRSKQKVYDLVNTNTDLKTFITLTYAENMQDYDKAIQDFSIFRKRINRYMEKHYGAKFKFVAVLEKQKRGAFHFHIMCNLPISHPSKITTIHHGSNGKQYKKYKKTVQQMQYETKFQNKFWKHGWTDVTKPNNAEKECDNFGAYISKYFTKDITLHIENKKRYLSSKNLDKPIEINFVLKDGLNIVTSNHAYFIGSTIEEIFNLLDIEVSNYHFNTSYKSEWLGVVEIYEYKRRCKNEI